MVVLGHSESLVTLANHVCDGDRVFRGLTPQVDILPVVLHSFLFPAPIHSLSPQPLHLFSALHRLESWLNLLGRVILCRKESSTRFDRLGLVDRPF